MQVSASVVKRLAEKTPTEPSSLGKTTTSTSSRKAMIFYVVMLVVIFVALIVTGLLLMYMEGDPKNGTEVCQTEACVEAGKALYESINFKANPCDDFFEYACGNWIAQNPIPSDKYFFGTHDMVRKKLMSDVRELLEKKTMKSKRPVAKSVQFALDFFRECMDTDTGYEPLKQQLIELLGTSWPILDDRFKSKDNFVETFARLKRVSVDVIVKFDIGYDAKKTDTNIIHFAVPSVDSDFRRMCANYSSNVIQFVLIRNIRLKLAELIAGENVDEKLLMLRITEVVQFECKLALLFQNNSWNNKMSFAAFKANTSNRLDWTELLRVYTAPFNLSYSFNDTDLVVVHDIAYYHKVTQLLVDTPTHVLYNYLGLKFLSVWNDPDVLHNFNYYYSIGLEKSKSKKCLLDVVSQTDWAISQLYVDQLMVPGTKERVEEMIINMKAAFIEIIQSEAIWLGKTTRARILEKVAAVLYYVAYPNWIHDNAELDSRFGFTNKSWAQVKKGRYLESVFELKKFSQAKLYQEFKKPRSTLSDRWYQLPINVGASAGLEWNSIIIPAGILRPPYFDPARPAYLNYGAIGAVISHEITHHFDNRGSQFDKAGNMVNWWDKKTKMQFKNGLQCFVEQYGSIVDQATNMKLNGTQALADNVADNGGIRQSFLAYQSFAKKHPMQLVPLMESFTCEQMFFLSWAKIWCSNDGPEGIGWQIRNDVHSPPRYRVNVPLGNFEHFAEAFNCQVGSKMNPEKKCRVW